MAIIEVAKVVLEKQTLKEILKNLKEVKTGQKGNVSSRSGKGQLNIISEPGDDLNLNLSKKELKERENRYKEIDAFNALITNIEAKEAEEKKVAKDVVKYEPIVHFSRMMLQAYIIEITKMDVDIATVLTRKPILKPFPFPNDVEKSLVS